MCKTPGGKIHEQNIKCERGGRLATLESARLQRELMKGTPCHFEFDPLLPRPGPRGPLARLGACSAVRASANKYASNTC